MWMRGRTTERDPRLAGRPALLESAREDGPYGSKHVSAAGRSLTITGQEASYLREHSIGSILRCSLKIYRENFRTLFLIYSLPALPFMVAQQEAQAAEVPLLIAATVIINLFVGTVAFAVITMAISDMCLGERPGVIRAYKRLRGPVIARLAWANLLQVLATFGGFLLLFIPGVIIVLRLIFTPIVATVEGSSGRAALKRSAALGKGFHWRNLGVLAILAALTFAILAVIGIGMVLGMIGAAAVFGLDISTEGPAILGVLIRSSFALVILCMYPLAFTVLTLTYYDLRVRKEAYDLDALAEDLRR